MAEVTGRVGPAADDAGLESFSGRHLSGIATVVRTGFVGFPVYELIRDGEAIASMGRFGWFRILIGSGQRIELTDGHRWRVKSKAVGGGIYPRVVDEAGRKVAVASLGTGYYGIDGKDYAHVLFSARSGGVAKGDRWILRDFDEELAVITPSPLRVEAFRPVHLAAVFLSFALMRYGIPGESSPKFRTFRWG